MEENGSQAFVEAQGLRFPCDPAILDDSNKQDIAAGAAVGTLAHVALSLCRTTDRVAAIGVGCGLVPALLTARLGVRHVSLVEPETSRQDYLKDLARANALARQQVVSELATVVDPTLLIADLTSATHELPERLADRYRGVILKLPNDFRAVRSTFQVMAASELTFFPRKSSGEIAVFLHQWH